MYVTTIAEVDRNGSRGIAVRRRRVHFHGHYLLSGPAGAPDLATLPPNVAAAIEQVFPQSSVADKTGYALSAYNWCLASIEQGILNDYEPGVISGTAISFTGASGGCSDLKSSMKTALTGAVGGTAMSVGTTLLLHAGVATAATPVGWVLLSAGAVLEGLSFLFGKHAKAVAVERGTLCAALPAANAAFEQIDTWLAQGQITPATAAAALDSLQSQFESMIKPIWHGQNEAGGYDRALRGIVIRRKLDLQGMQPVGAAAAAGAAGIASLSPATLLIVGLIAYSLLG